MTTDPVIRGNSLYTIVDGPSWTHAEANAQKLGGHLVTINNEAENAFVNNKVVIPGYQEGATDYWFWMGARGNTDGTISWSSGEEYQYSNWLPEEGPNDSQLDWYLSSIGYTGVFEPYIRSDGEWSSLRGTNHDGNTRDVNPNGYSIAGIAETPVVIRGDSAYAIVQGPTWEEAEANAQKLGGHLVTINDAEEWSWFKSQFSPANGYAYDESYNYYPNGEVQLWVGANDTENEGQYKWVSGESSSVTQSDLLRLDGGTPIADDYGVWQWEQGKIAFYTRQLPDDWDSSAKNIRGIAEIKLSGTSLPTDDGKPPAAPTLNSIYASASDTASASGLEGLNLDVGGAANVQAPVTLKSTSDAITVEGNVKSDAHATEVRGISTSTLHSASDLSVGSVLKSIVTGTAESTSGIAIANALVDTQHGIDLTDINGVDALASGGSSTVTSTSTLTATSTAQTVGDGSSDSGYLRLDGAWANTIAEDHLGLGSTGTLTLDSESDATVSTSMVSNLSSTATASDGLAVATAQLLSSTGIENLNAEVGGLGLVTSVNQGVFKADATSTTDDASAMGINKVSAGILDSTFSFGITDSTITAKDLNSLQVSATSTGGDAWSKLQSSSTGIADLYGIENRITDAGSISAIASDQGFANSATVSGSSTAFASQEAIGMSGYEVHSNSGLTLNAQALVISEANSSAVSG